MKPPLTGLTVLDFTRVYSGPYATLMLCDMGAEVIKVEHPDGGDDSRQFGPFVGGTSGYFETLNRGKKSVAIDYRSGEGQAILRDLAASVDVLIENFRPGQMAKYGLDYPALSAINPRLIYVSISGYGQTGPYAAHGCYDVVAQAMSGLMSLTGLPELPIKTGPAIADAITGLTAAVALLGALWGRERTGEGTYIDIAMMDSVFASLENALAVTSATGHAPARSGNADPVIAPFDVYPTRDGWVAIGVGNDRLWNVFASLLDADCAGEGLHLAGNPRLATNADRVQHYDDLLRPIIARWCADQDAAPLIERLHDAGIPAGTVRTLEELSRDPQLELRGMLHSIPFEDTTLLLPGSPIHIAGVEKPPIRRAPRLGEHTSEVLALIQHGHHVGA